jgi:hypothetical protein
VQAEKRAEFSRRHFRIPYRCRQDLCVVLVDRRAQVLVDESDFPGPGGSGGGVLRDCAEGRARWLSAFYDHRAVLVDRTTDLCLAIPEGGRAAEMVRCESSSSNMVLAPIAPLSVE